MKTEITTGSILLIVFTSAVLTQAQVNKDELAMAISKAEAANTEQLKAYIWKRKSDVSVDGQVKLTTISEFSFNPEGKVQAKLVDAQSNVKKKRGVRGRIQEGAIEDKAEYIQKALGLSVAYTFMSKGELIDFFAKATVTEKGGTIDATAADVYVKGDKLTVVVDAKTNLFVKKTFSSLVEKDAISGEINYEKFSTGVSHGSATILDMPAQKMKINAVNQDYSQRVK